MLSNASTTKMAAKRENMVAQPASKPATLATELLEHIDELSFSHGTVVGESLDVHPIHLAGQPLRLKLTEDLGSVSVLAEPVGYSPQGQRKTLTFSVPQPVFEAFVALEEACRQNLAGLAPRWEVRAFWRSSLCPARGEQATLKAKINLSGPLRGSLLRRRRDAGGAARRMVRSLRESAGARSGVLRPAAGQWRPLRVWHDAGSNSPQLWGSQLPFLNRIVLRLGRIVPWRANGQVGPLCVDRLVYPGGSTITPHPCQDLLLFGAVLPIQRQQQLNGPSVCHNGHAA